MISVVQNSICLMPNDGVIVHQVNCKAVMGSGVAKALCCEFPDLRDQYLEFCRGKSSKSLLGEVHIAKCVHRVTGEEHLIANVFGQLDYGRDPNTIYTDYHALEVAFTTLSLCYKKFYIPYGIGAGLANGNWKKIVGIMNNSFSTSDVVLCKISNDAVRFGFTERCDPSVNYGWVNNLSKDGNVIISKNLTDTLINTLLTHKDKIIFHHTVTGFGGKLIEKNVPPKEWSRSQFNTLIENGFPVEQTVLRIDPIIPTEKGVGTALSVMDLYADSGIKRVRFSFMDMYEHVAKRFVSHGIPLPYETFHAPSNYMLPAVNCLTEKADVLGYQLESCAEAILYKKGCLSELDYQILNIPFEQCVKSQQRYNCLCCGSKYELLPRDAKCQLGCLYCYWKD